MLTKRIIPCLDVKEGRVVKGTGFVNLKDAGDPVELAKLYNSEGADELVFLDITASHEKRGIILEVVRKTAEEVFIPLTVGGGINNVETIRNLLLAGADKVSINTAAINDPEFISEASKIFGTQCIVVAIDAKRVKPDEIEPHLDGVHRPAAYRLHPLSRWEVYTHGGRKPTGIDAVLWAKEAENRGAGEILLTSMDQDGTKAGYDIELTKAVAEGVSIPVIASGGAGTLAHIDEAFTRGKAEAALLASLLHFRELSVGQIKNYLNQHQIPVRIKQ